MLIKSSWLNSNLELAIWQQNYIDNNKDYYDNTLEKPIGY